MTMVTILEKHGRPAFAVVDYAEYERLLAAAEDADDARAARAALADGGEETPGALVERIVAGESPVRVWRQHRGLTQSALAAETGLSQAYIAGIETGKTPGSVKALLAIAAALGTYVLSPGSRIVLAVSHRAHHDGRRQRIALRDPHRVL